MLTAFVLILTTRESPAPLYGTFPGLKELIDGAEFIFIAQIIKRPEQLDMGSGGVFEIEILTVLKGEAKDNKRSNAYLRDLPFVFAPGRDSTLTHGLTGERYLLFLNKNTGKVRDEKDQPLPVDFENENCAGDAVWMSSEFNWTLLEGKGLRESIEVILKDSAKAQRDSAAAMSAMVENRRTTLTHQRFTSWLWFDGNAEEAMKFYKSVFASRRDYTSNHYLDLGPQSQDRVAGFSFMMDEQEFIAVNRGADSKSTQNAMLTVNCDTQEEIDYFWDKLSAGGKTSRWGWLKDKFGLSWHIVPTGLAQLLRDSDAARADRVMKALLKMDKIDEAALWTAHAGK